MPHSSPASSTLVSFSSSSILPRRSRPRLPPAGKGCRTRAGAEASFSGGGGREKMRGRKRRKERREKERENRRGRSGGGRERSPADVGLRRRGRARPGGWWRLDPLMDPSSSTSPPPTTKHGSGSMRSNFLDGIQSVLSGVARGCGWQKICACIKLGTFYAVVIPTAYLLAFVLHVGWGLWMGTIFGILVQVLLFVAITLHTNWQNEDYGKEQWLFRFWGNGMRSLTRKFRISVFVLTSERKRSAAETCFISRL